jgi:hypothetical protein
MSDAIEVYETYFECIGPGKCKGCHQRWTCPVTKLRAYILKVQGKDIRLCTKSYSSQEVEAMQLLDAKLAEVTNAQKKQRVEDQSDPLLDPGTSTQAAPASQRSGTSQQPRTPASARTPLCLRKGSSPFLALCFRKGSSPFIAWPL